jgi:RNA polymerase sigma-70 factor (ECF subfamily)
MSEDPRQELIAAIPRVRAFAISLLGRGARADDLVQETLVKAWAKIDSFGAGSNMLAWLYTIMRNEYYSGFRRSWREVADPDGVVADSILEPAAQDSHMDFRDFQKVFRELPDHHREAIILVGASGLSYEDAARVCGCAVGTMKSRVSRARAMLAQLLEGHPKRDGLVVT